MCFVFTNLISFILSIVWFEPNESFLCIGFISLKLHCALFGEYVEYVNEFLSLSYLEQPVVVVQLAKVKFFRGIWCDLLNLLLFQWEYIWVMVLVFWIYIPWYICVGKVGLQDVTYATKLMFNPDIVEVVNFRVGWALI